ncbi:MAG TPA: glycosyltransferase family 9 protein, partial [Phycisphaerae bacterium]|nr:glycosyltransferase family 9 protein [Phycisphaerae bacterium]
MNRPPISADLAGREFSRILIIKPSSPGDIIHALPVLRGLRRRFPRAHIAWLAATPFVNLLDADPALSEVIHFDRAHFARVGRSWRATVDFFKFVRELRGRKFDLVIDLQGLIRSGFMSLFSGARERIGFRDSRELAWIFYNRRIPRLPPDMHAADKLFAVSEMLGFEDAPKDFTIEITPEDRAHADELLAQAGVSPVAPFAVLVPGTRWETKRWPVDRFGELAQVLHDRHALPSVFVGAASDRKDASRALSHQCSALSQQRHARKEAVGVQMEAVSESDQRNLCGKTTFRELAAIIDRAAIVVTPDSAPMHIAAAHSRPLVALFGPTNPLRTGPHGRLDSVVRLPLACSPCY